ncbi:MAG TPA: hypothetical protein VM431_13350 [Phycisphaerae bacterium]|nr:hypothetical protein [Phycisphaerae bacterium]
MILSEEDTYSVASKLKGMRFKIRVEDPDKIAAAQQLVHDHIDVQAILAALAESD